MHSNDHKSKFALAVLHKTLQHFDSGGQVQTQTVPNHLSGPTTAGPNTSTANGPDITKATNTYTNPGGILGGSNSVASQIFNPVGGLIGMGQNNFQASAAPIQAGTNAEQLNTAYDTAQGGLTNQQNFVNALQGQNGVQNQSNNYNQLGQIAQGQGPNPAQALLNNQTGQNIANQAALMAGQRGSGANAGMIARQAAQQGANTQQQAVGQGAALQAQQSLNAINAQTGVAQNQVNQLGQGLNGYNASAQNEQNILQQANSAYNSANVNMTSNMNQVNAGVAGANAANRGGILGGIFNSVSSMAGGFFAEGGDVNLGKPAFKDSSESAPLNSSNGSDVKVPTYDMSKDKRSKGGGSDGTVEDGKSDGDTMGSGAEGAGGMLGGLMAEGGNVPQSSLATEGGNVPQSSLARHIHSSSNKMAEGGAVPAMVSPGEQYLPPEDVKKVKQGANPLAVGEKIPGKPKYPGNDYRNDVVKKTLQSGGIVIPNKIMQSENPSDKAAKFVKATEAKKGRSMPKRRGK